MTLNDKHVDKNIILVTLKKKNEEIKENYYKNKTKNYTLVEKGNRLKIMKKRKENM